MTWLVPTDSLGRLASLEPAIASDRVMSAEDEGVHVNFIDAVFRAARGCQSGLTK